MECIALFGYFKLIDADKLASQTWRSILPSSSLKYGYKLCFYLSDELSISSTFSHIYALGMMLNRSYYLVLAFLKHIYYDYLNARKL